MVICVVEGSQSSHSGVARLIRKVSPQHKLSILETMKSDTDLSIALEVCNMKPDMVFLNTSADIHDSVDLAGSLMKAMPDAGIVLIASDDRLAAEAFRIHTQGYLITPLTDEMVQREIEYYKETHPDTETAGKQTNTHELAIQTFGNFDMFIDGRPVKLKRVKTRELLAYLIDRKGCLVADNELLMVLFGKNDKTSKSILRMLKAELISIFKEAGYEDAVIKQRGMIGVCSDRIRCDLFDAVMCDPPDMRKYCGEYMSQYSWSRDTRIRLDHLQAQQKNTTTL